MQKTKIEWADYTWNPIKGLCPVGCSYCYARRMYKRFGWDPEIRLDEKELWEPGKTKHASVHKRYKIFVGSTIELYHPRIPRYWIEEIINVTLHVSWHIYITLTKFPGLLDYNFPFNWWVGTTITGEYGSYELNHLKLIQFPIVSGKRFISFEPLLGPCDSIDLRGLDWIIIGGLTPKPIHQKEWIDRLVKKADEHNIPVFIKDNAHYLIERREFPKEDNHERL